jgi:hypothetical protein
MASSATALGTLNWGIGYRSHTASDLSYNPAYLFQKQVEFRTPSAVAPFGAVGQLRLLVETKIFVRVIQSRLHYQVCRLPTYQFSVH